MTKSQSAFHINIQTSQEYILVNLMNRQLVKQQIRIKAVDDLARLSSHISNFEWCKHQFRYFIQVDCINNNFINEYSISNYICVRVCFSV